MHIVVSFDLPTDFPSFGRANLLHTECLYLGKVLLRAIPGAVPEAPLAAAISLPPCAGRCRAGAWPSSGTGGGSDRINRPGCGPSMSLVGPPRHVLHVLHGCMGSKARNQYKPTRRRT